MNLNERARAAAAEAAAAQRDPRFEAELARVTRFVQEFEQFHTRYAREAFDTWLGKLGIERGTVEATFDMGSHVQPPFVNTGNPGNIGTQSYYDNELQWAVSRCTLENHQYQVFAGMKIDRSITAVRVYIDDVYIRDGSLARIGDFLRGI